MKKAVATELKVDWIDRATFEPLYNACVTKEPVEYLGKMWIVMGAHWVSIPKDLQAVYCVDAHFTVELREVIEARRVA